MTFWRKPPPPPEPAPTNPVMLGVQIAGVAASVLATGISWWRSRESSQCAAQAEAWAVRAKNHSDTAEQASVRMVASADRLVAAAAAVEAKAK